MTMTRAEIVLLEYLAKVDTMKLSPENDMRLDLMKVQFPKMGPLRGSRKLDNVRSWSMLIQGDPKIGIWSETEWTLSNLRRA